MNNTVVVDHQGLFIYLDCGYLCSYHDVTILCRYKLHKNWHQFFLHGDEYFEYLLGDLGYVGEEMFIMRRIGRHEISPNANKDAIKTYNKMHVGYKVWVEWGIGELKRKWKWLMKRFDSTKPKYTILFKDVFILIFFLRKHQMDFTFEVISE